MFDLTFLFVFSLGYNDSVLTLLQAGADPNRVDAHGFTALHRASWEGHVPVVRTLLLSSDAFIEAACRKGARAVHKAAECGLVDVVRELVSSR